MANIGTFTIENTEYEDFEVLKGIKLNVGTTYTLQVRVSCYICLKNELPAHNEGFYFTTSNNTYTFTVKDGLKLYVRSDGLGSINICE